MNSALQSIANLSPDKKRALLEQLLREKAARHSNIPLSSAQQRLWFLDKLEPNSALYNIPTLIRLRGSVKIEVLRAGLNEILRRHAALRTRFVSSDDQATQVVTEATEVPWTFHDLSSKPVYERQFEANSLIQAEAQKPFDLSADLMIRATLIRVGPEEHLLALVTHHIASDEWSLKVLFKELSAFYTARARGLEPTLPELPIQYTDYAFWERERMRSDAFQQQVAYWKEQLKGPLPPLDLPTDKPRRGVQTYRGALTRRLIPKETLTAVKELARQEGATLFMALLSGFQTLLHRYTGQHDIVVGSPIAGRTRPETEPLIGFFVNTLALRGRFSDSITFRELLAQVKSTTLGAFANQEAPFEKLVEHLHPDRNGASSPFVQTLFALNNEYSAALELPGVVAESIEVDTRTAKFELTMVAVETPEGLEVVAEYNTDLFELSSIERLLGHYEQLLSSAVAEPTKPVVLLNMLSDDERKQLIERWNATTTDYPRDMTVHALFDRQAELTPRAIAAEYGDETITYADLQRRSNQLANYLLEEAVTDSRMIGLCVERSIDMLVGMLGILKAGCAYVPLDPSYPRERLAFMIEDTRMAALITQSRLADQFSNYQLKTVALDRDAGALKKQSAKSPTVQARAEDPVYIIYTSGSTGKPKGAVIPHRGVVRLVFNTNYIELSSRDRIAQASNASFDAATFEIWGALLHGGRLVGIEKETALSPEDFTAQLREKKVTALFVTTALFNALASNVPGAFDGIRTVMFGGEACDPKWIRSVLMNRPPKRLLHVYGPTESTTFATWFEIENVSANATTVPIGRPLSNTQIYVLDRNRNPTPIGVPGEVYVGGDGLASGYWNRPELTAEKFVPNSFGPPGSRLYRTGDLGRFKSDGSVEFVGRIDHQVKIRGFRIELGEIEAALMMHPMVREAATLAREDQPGEKRLVAYIVPKQQGTADIESLRAWMKQKLPEYMVPSAFVVMESFPLTPNEKIDRKALPAPERNAVEKNFVAPRDGVEQQLAKIWEKALGVQPIGVNDNFFDLGGHSLLAVRVFAQIDKHLGKKLPLATLFKAPTIAELANIIRAKDSHSDDWSVIVDLQPSGSKPPIFWCHSLGGDGGGAFFYYRKLAELLGPDQPSYGIRSPQEPHDSLEEMAAHYIEEVKKIQPEGPYYLGGFCFGGNVAYEMARQLREQGDDVAMLALLESAPPPTSSKSKLTAEAAIFRIENVFEAFKEFAGKDSNSRRDQIIKKGRKLKQRIQIKLFGQPHAPAAEPQLDQMIDMANYPKDYIRYAETHWKALRSFHPKPYNGTIHLFRARKQPLSTSDPSLGWEALAEGRVRVTVVPGNHETIVQEPNVQTLALELNRALERARSRSIPRQQLEPALVS